MVHYQRLGGECEPRIEPHQSVLLMEKPIQLLLVEDNAGDARLLRELLREITTARFEITLVSRLSEALSKLHTNRFDVVLTDLSLPDSQGLSAFRELHAAAPMVPIIVLSGVDVETL